MRYYLALLWCCASFWQLSAQADSSAARAAEEGALKLGLKNFDDGPRQGRAVRLTFYNVENLFDTEDDPKKRDDEFTPRGLKGWSYFRYKQKLSNIYKVLTALGGWGGPPEMVGFCELENRKVLEDLLRLTPLQKFRYKIVHEESPDRRGIDVGFIYRSDKFEVLHHEPIRVVFPFDTAVKTRDVLYVCGKVLGSKDSLHIFVNHWPSRRGGQAASEPKRVFVAGLVRAKIDSIYKASPEAKIAVMGDFNDEAENISLTEVLRAVPEKEDLGPGDMYNYMHALSKNWQLGSHKFRGHWGTLDHMVVSTPLVQESRKGRLRAAPLGAQIFSARFLLEEDRAYMGLQPFRTYGGPKFLGGFSDHLPIYVDLIYE
ncbi:endonuclease [Saprospira grandis]|uniref:Endonuclease/exonuclease/phosphatase n=1 Tax=Saprospira grandis (strain Lewin) TaxID=984262 RepID=H6L7S8_SAPGL|nr:endonuclease [Saprospira grandis]AFC24149.1 endonuclease/exonuclease/phosphatase [Saprospira grandis str. Lewin]